MLSTNVLLRPSDPFEKTIKPSLDELRNADSSPVASSSASQHNFATYVTFMSEPAHAPPELHKSKYAIQHGIRQTTLTSSCKVSVSFLN